ARRRRWGELRDRMAPTRSTAELHPVAGCLFEVSLPPGRVVTETWHVLDGADGDEPPGTTLLAVIPPGSSVAGVAGRLPEPGTVIWRFRFRAEREGRMTLRFERRNELGQPTATYWVELGVAPEKLAEDP
ncbi:MAG TPA: hypothetical protein VFO60_11110, partial [Candidatus Dormibacteraeota bacterium]|nr:hypothetical protein [Candidatus Dormibacteraeota bacterium]